MIKTRFAPSPTGYMHIGNARMALINYLYAKKYNGKFIVRIDDTDQERSKKLYKDSIMDDLKWLNINYEYIFFQNDRLARYERIINQLIEERRLYPCFETKEELEMKRKNRLSQKLPPIYDRSALKLSQDEIDQFIKEGRKPHYRFKLQNAKISWNDEIKGEMAFEASDLTDPIIMREDGSYTYMLCSVVDDIDHEISHVIRGEDHLINTAIQIQMFEALNAKPPIFSHLSLIKSDNVKISKREGGFDIKNIRDNEGVEYMALNSFLTIMGSNHKIDFISTMNDLINIFDISLYSKQPSKYNPERLTIINHKILSNSSFDDIKYRLQEEKIDITPAFWEAIKSNLFYLQEAKEWSDICSDSLDIDHHQYDFDRELIDIAINSLPEMITDTTWKEWTKDISMKSGKKGKSLFLPLRIALTGKQDGPELKNLLPLLSRELIIKRLAAAIQEN